MCQYTEAGAKSQETRKESPRLRGIAKIVAYSGSFGKYPKRNLGKILSLWDNLNPFA